jgi:tRNA pseudouridine38-40 synthase
MEIQYEGTRYKGWQRLKTTEATIQSKIETVLTRLLDESIEIQGSGRTDAGVHARKQIASFKTQSTMTANVLLHEMNQYLPDDIAITSLSASSDTFHARYNAQKKTYVYQIWMAPYPSVFDRHFVLDIGGKPLDIEAMKRASRLFIGTHDFKGYSADKTKKSTVRTIDKINFFTEGQLLKIALTGNGFLYNMVRIIVGTLIEIGLGNRDASTIEEVFQSNNRELAGETAPAKGLILDDVYYG